MKVEIEEFTELVNLVDRRLKESGLNAKKQKSLQKLLQPIMKAAYDIGKHGKGKIDV